MSLVVYACNAIGKFFGMGVTLLLYKYSICSLATMLMMSVGLVNKCIDISDRSYTYYYLKMSYFYYHWCAVPKCKNTSKKTPNKLWIHVPNEINMRKLWFKVAKRDPESLCEKTRLYFCEDHFNVSIIFIYIQNIIYL